MGRREQPGAGPGESSDFNAVPPGSRLAGLEDTLATLDTMGCQRKIAETMIDQRGDYLLAAKGTRENCQEATCRPFGFLQPALRWSLGRRSRSRP